MNDPGSPEWVVVNRQGRVFEPLSDRRTVRRSRDLLGTLLLAFVLLALVLLFAFLPLLAFTALLVADFLGRRFTGRYGVGRRGRGAAHEKSQGHQPAEHDTHLSLLPV